METDGKEMKVLLILTIFKKNQPKFTQFNLFDLINELLWIGRLPTKSMQLKNYS